MVYNLRTTHTYSVLEVSKETYDNIRKRLGQASPEDLIENTLKDDEFGDVVILPNIALAVEKADEETS